MKPDIFPLILIRSAGLPSEILHPNGTDISSTWKALQDSEADRQSHYAALLHTLSQALMRLPDSPLRTAVYKLRKRLHHQPHYLPAADWAHDRENTEARHIREKIRDLHTSTEQCRSAMHTWEEAYRQSQIANVAALQRIATDTDVLERALLFSSHDLLAALPAFASKASGACSKKDRATAQSLLAYVSRAVYKTVPLSAWASIGVWQPDLDEDSTSPFGKTIATPHVEMLPLLYEALLQEPHFRKALQVRLNPSYNRSQCWLQSEPDREIFYHSRQQALSAISGWITEAGGQMPYSALKSNLLDNVEANSAIMSEAFLIECAQVGLIEWVWPEAGLSPGWCSTLYHFLGHLPATGILTQAACLLQWLRSTARTLPFQTGTAARAAQRAAHEQVNQFFSQYLPAAPVPRPEQLFYLDVERPIRLAVPESVVMQAITDLQACWQMQNTQRQPLPYSLLTHYAREVLRPQERMDALDFCRGYMERSAALTDAPLPPIYAPRFRGKMGATLEFFQTDEGAYRAVVNGLFPGGGKMYARWAHLLPPNFHTAVEHWADLPAFGWQGWSNVNFQPAATHGGLSLPGDRRGRGGIRLGDCAVMLNEHLLPQLIEQESEKVIVCTDLGLEAVEAKPPVMQVLWHLSVPQISADMLLTPDVLLQPPEQGDWGYRLPRQEWRGLVLRRAIWQVEEREWQQWRPERANDERVFFQNLRDAMERLGLPQYVWASWPGRQGSARGFCLTHPLQVVLLHKVLRQGSGLLLLTEMLPAPDQYLRSDSGGHCAAEFVVEFSTF